MKEKILKFGQMFKHLNGGIVIIIVLFFILGWQLGHRDYQLKLQNFKPELTILGQSDPYKNSNIDFKLFWDTWDLLTQKYIDKKALDPQKLYYGAIQGMVAAVGDPYTVFLPPEAQKSTKEQLSGSFEGVGIQLGFNKEKRLAVIAPLKDTPAEEAGVKAGDIILKVDEKEGSNLSLPEVVSLIRGPRGTIVTLSLFREDNIQPFDVKLTRETIIIKSVVVSKKITKAGKTVAVMRISQFGEKTKTEWNEAVSEALSYGPQGIVVDLRNNPGGFLDGAVYILSEFFDQGALVLQEDGQGNRQELDVMRAGKMLKLPLSVLINKGSASASEIIAGAVQDRERGTLIGEVSFGKGTIQSAEDLAQETGIHVTTAKWLTPNGNWVHNTGLTPDIKVEAGEDISKDPQLELALEQFDI